MVIAIIGILASIVLVNLSSARTKANNAKALSSLESVAQIASMCTIGGGTLNIPAVTSNPSGTICSNGTETFPDLTGTGFSYCGNGCGLWWDAGNGSYAISVYNNSTYNPSAHFVTAVICSSNVNVTGWYYLSSNEDFTGVTACRTYGF